jgi:hypothetical protein
MVLQGDGHYRIVGEGRRRQNDSKRQSEEQTAHLGLRK